MYRGGNRGKYRRCRSFGTAELPDDAECVTGNIEFTISGVSIYSFSEHSPETLTAATFLHDLNELVNTGGDTPRFFREQLPRLREPASSVSSTTDS